MNTGAKPWWSRWYGVPGVITGFGLLWMLVATPFSGDVIMSDASVFYYLASRMSDGAVLYRDIIYTNTPGAIYVAYLIFLLSGGSIAAYHLWGVVVTIIPAILVFFITVKLMKERFGIGAAEEHVYEGRADRTCDNEIHGLSQGTTYASGDTTEGVAVIAASIASGIYLSSYILLSSSFPDGPKLTLIFLLSAYLCLLYRRWFFVGFLAACGILVKAYSLPIVAALAVAFVVDMIKGRNAPNDGATGKDTKRPLVNETTGDNPEIHKLYGKQQQDWTPGIVRGVSGFILGFLLIMGHTLIAAWPEFARYTFGFSLGRSEGTNSLGLFGTFLRTDTLVALLACASVGYLHRNAFIGTSIIGMLVFFVLYKNVFFLYFVLFVPFAAITGAYVFADGYEYTKRKGWSTHKVILTIAGILVLLFARNAYGAHLKFSNLSSIPADDSLIRTIVRLQPDYIYGPSSFIQSVSFASGVPVLDNMPDLNPGFFRTGILDGEVFTDRIFEERTVVVVPAARSGETYHLPLYIFNESRILDGCVVEHARSNTAPGMDVYLVLRCYGVGPDR